MGICSLINKKYFLLHGKSWSQIERFSFIGKFIEYHWVERSLMWSISSWKCRFSHTISICYNIKIANVCIYILCFLKYYKKQNIWRFFKGGNLSFTFLLTNCMGLNKNWWFITIYYKIDVVITPPSLPLLQDTWYVVQLWSWQVRHIWWSCTGN